MEQQKKNFRPNYFMPVRTIVVMIIICGMIGFITSGFKDKEIITKDDEVTAAHNDNFADSVESVEAFMQVYKVLMSPRCMNCHPSGDIPLQGDDNHLHTMFPKRGKDGKGVYAMKCANCHQPENTPGLHTPPGNPNWHLPAADMKLVFQGKTASELAKQLMDPKQNGHKTKEQLIAHASDGLVIGAWNPGEGRTLPPMSYDAFKKAWVTWIEKGAYTPQP
jgi:hypothetical protein